MKPLPWIDQLRAVAVVKLPEYLRDMRVRGFDVDTHVCAVFDVTTWPGSTMVGQDAGAPAVGGAFAPDDLLRILRANEPTERVRARNDQIATWLRAPHRAGTMRVLLFGRDDEAKCERHPLPPMPPAPLVGGAPN